MRPELEILIGHLPELTLLELDSRSKDSRSLIRVAYKWRGCVDCGRAPWKDGDEHVSLRELECDHLDASIKEYGGSNSLTGHGGGKYGRDQKLWSYLTEMLKTEPRCRPCHDRYRTSREVTAIQQSLFIGNGEAWVLNGNGKPT